jgi:hypothetical protein
MRTKGILVVANEAVESALLLDAIRLGLDAIGPADVTIVAPALNTRARHWACDDAGARRTAELRLARSIESLAAEGVDTEGWVGDADPILAVRDALRQVPVDLLVVATQDEASSNWRAHDLPERMRGEFALPVLLVSVDWCGGEELLYDGGGRPHGRARLARAA